MFSVTRARDSSRVAHGGRRRIPYQPARLSCYVALALALMPRFADQLVYFPTREHDGGTPAALRLAYEDVALVAGDGVHLHAWWVPAAPARRTVLFLHGNAGNISHRLDKLAVLHGFDANVLLLDYRGYGHSEGAPDEDGTYRDAEAAYGWLCRRGIAARTIIAYGESLGGPIAVDLATRRPLGGVVLESAPSSIVAVAKHHYPWAPVEWFLSARYDALARIGGVRAPILILHSPGDEIVPFAMAEELRRGATAPVTFVRLAGGHNDAFIAAADAYRTALREFFAQAEGT